jgi:hypothetical protein
VGDTEQRLKGKNIFQMTCENSNITGIINQVLKPSWVQKQRTLRIYETAALRTILFGTERLDTEEASRFRIIAPEMKILRKTEKYILFDHKRRQGIMKKLEAQPVLEKVNKHEDVTCSQGETGL